MGGQQLEENFCKEEEELAKIQVKGNLAEKTLQEVTQTEKKRMTVLRHYEKSFSLLSKKKTVRLQS